MPYFVILTYFAVAVAAWGAALTLLASMPDFRNVVRTGVRMLVGSLVGFVVANLCSLLIGVVPALLAMALHVDRDDPAAQVVAAFALVGLFFGPLVASPLGFVGGALLGLRRALRLQRAAPAVHLAPVRQ